MKVLVDIGHPAHVHFFRNPMRLLLEHGHEVLITSRNKEIAVELLDELGIEHVCLSALGKGGLLSLGRELIQRDWALWRIVRRFRPDVMAAIGGVNIAHVSRVTGVPSLVFYDTENARLQNAITYPFASCVIVPRCYESWLPPRRHIRYAGYHELSYLHPQQFTPDRDVALRNGVDPQRDTFFLRTVSWRANHDVGELGWSYHLLEKLVHKLESHGTVLISSESPLPDSLLRYRYAGRISDVHHVLAYCRAFIGESATMASECAVLGVPAIYAAHTGRGYTNEQEARYGLVINVSNIAWENVQAAVDQLLTQPLESWATRRAQLLAETVDVAAFATRCIETFPDPLLAYVSHQPSH